MKNIITKIARKIEGKMLARSHRDELSINAKLKNSKKGKRCFILGNGPSLNTQDLTKLVNEETFVVNTFWNHPQYQEINPKYYVIVDTEVFPQKEATYWSKNLLDRKSVVESRPNTTMFFNVLGKELVEKNNLYPKNPKYYLALDGYLKENLKFNIEIDRTIPKTKNVIIACLMTAVYMGFEEIILIGCEHDFLAHPIDKHYEGFKHFYKTNYSGTDTEDIKNYRLSTGTYEHYISQALILFKNYRLLKKKVLKTNPGVKIFNATPNSFLDVFPFVKFEDIKL